MGYNRRVDTYHIGVRPHEAVMMPTQEGYEISSNVIFQHRSDLHFVVGILQVDRNFVEVFHFGFVDGRAVVDMIHLEMRRVYVEAGFVAVPRD